MELLKRLAVILTMLMTVFIGFGLIIPVLPLMIKNVGAQPLNLGLMLAVYSAVAFLMSPWWGHISDRIGRKPVLLIGLLGFAISFIVFGLAAHLLWLMYVARIIGGGFSGAVTATAMAYVADVTSVENRTKGMAFAGMSIGMGFIIGPGVGGLLAHFGNVVPFFVAGVLAIGNAIWGAMALPESMNQTDRQNLTTSVPSKSRWAAFSGPLKYLFLVGFVGQFTITSLEGTFQYFEMDKIGATAGEIGTMFFISGTVGALIQGGVVQRYVTHGREVFTLYTGLIVSGMGMFLILFSRNFWTAALFMTLFGAGNTVIKPTLTSLITKQTKVGQGLTNGLMSSLDSLARIVGPLLATALFQLDHNIPFILAGAAALLATTLVAGYRHAFHKAMDGSSASYDSCSGS